MSRVAMLAALSSAGARRFARCRRTRCGAFGSHRLARGGGSLGAAALARGRAPMFRERFLRYGRTSLTLQSAGYGARALRRNTFPGFLPGFVRAFCTAPSLLRRL